MSQTHGGQPLRVLLIEDDEDDYVLTKALLDSLPGPYQLFWISSYAEGFAALCAGDYDIALVDFFLGAEDGVSMIAHARAAGCDLPLLLHTGKEDSDIESLSTAAGADGYLSKSRFDATQMEQTLKAAIVRRQAKERSVP